MVQEVMYKLSPTVLLVFPVSMAKMSSLKPFMNIFNFVSLVASLKVAPNILGVFLTTFLKM